MPKACGCWFRAKRYDRGMETALRVAVRADAGSAAIKLDVERLDPC